MIKLPPNKFTVREREMLMGVAGAPADYFAPVSGVAGGPSATLRELGVVVRRQPSHVALGMLRALFAPLL